MRIFYAADVDRFEGEPLFTVRVYDLDSSVNFHSYECLFFEQGKDYEELLKRAEASVKLES